MGPYGAVATNRQGACPVLRAVRPRHAPWLGCPVGDSRTATLIVSIRVGACAGHAISEKEGPILTGSMRTGKPRVAGASVILRSTAPRWPSSRRTTLLGGPLTSVGTSSRSMASQSKNMTRCGTHRAADATYAGSVAEGSDSVLTTTTRHSGSGAFFAPVAIVPLATSSGTWMF